jgi:hypothetical protein
MLSSAQGEAATAAEKALRAPRAAGIAGVVFSILITASFVLVRVTVPATPAAAGGWLSNASQRNAVIFGLNLVPFAGIAFLWFIGVVRDRIGQLEDRFFASVFLGSGLLFVGMLFVSAAMAGGLLASYGGTRESALAPDAWRLGRSVTFVLLTTFAMRMAAVFMIATATITLRVAVMPRWISLLGYLGALVLLVTVGSLPWVELIFPAWVFLVSLYILLASPSPRQTPSEPGPEVNSSGSPGSPS